MSFRSSMLLALVAVAFGAVSAHAESHNVPPEGFVALFNGRDLEGWRGGSTENPLNRLKLDPKERAEKDKASIEDIHKHWTVENGELVNDGKGLYLTTDKDYGDFELLIEYKTVARADSGIYLRGTPQVQIWDYHQGRRQVGAAAPTRAPAACGTTPPARPARTRSCWPTSPSASGTTFRIIMVGERVTVYLNDKLVVDHAPAGKLLRDAPAASAHRPDPAANARRRDPLAERLRARDQVSGESVVAAVWHAFVGDSPT